MNIKTYLGFDVGTKRTGIAISNNITHIANGISVVKNNKDGSTNFQKFNKIINAHDVDLFIVGLPFDANNKEQEMTFIARSFGYKLADRYNIETVFIDEYLSSYDAKKQLKYNHYHPNAKREDIDKFSAALILQTWLDDQVF